MSLVNFPTGKISLKKNNVNIIVSKKIAQFSVKYLLKAGSHVRRKRKRKR